jgi:hypothetical protein
LKRKVTSSKSDWRDAFRDLERANADAFDADSKRLCRRFKAGDPGALVDFLVRMLRVQILRGDAGEEDYLHDAVEVPRWVLGAALGYVLHGAGGFGVKGIALSKRGSSGSYGRRLQRELDDFRVHRAATEAATAARNLEEAFYAVHERLGVPEATVRASYYRAKRLLAADPRRYDVLEPYIGAMMSAPPAPRRRARPRRIE